MAEMTNPVSPPINHSYLALIVPDSTITDKQIAAFAPLTKQSLLFNPDTSICYDTVSICQEMWMERSDSEGGGHSVY